MSPTPQESGFDPAAALAEVEAATDALVATAAKLDDGTLREASLLPGWTRADVLAHVALNAEALVNLLLWAREGEQRPMYVSREERDAAIASGARRSAEEIAADVRTSAQTYAHAVRELPANAWDRTVRIGVAGAGAEIPARRILWQRLKELEIHHVDLDLDYTPAHWAEPFVARALEEAARMYGRREDAPDLVLAATDTDRRLQVGPAGDAPLVSGPNRALLAWLTGRSTGDGLTIEPAGRLPSLPPWA